MFRSIDREYMENLNCARALRLHPHVNEDDCEIHESSIIFILSLYREK